jgi:hypothetical protein
MMLSMVKTLIQRVVVQVFESRELDTRLVAAARSLTNRAYRLCGSINLAFLTGSGSLRNLKVAFSRYGQSFKVFVNWHCPLLLHSTNV